MNPDTEIAVPWIATSATLPLGENRAAGTSILPGGSRTVADQRNAVQRGSSYPWPAQVVAAICKHQQRKSVDSDFCAGCAIDAVAE